MNGDLLEVIRRANPAQDHEEFERLLLLLEGRPTERILEIGTHKGGSARAFRDWLHPGLLMTVCSTDEFEGDFERIDRIIGRSQNSTIVTQVRGFAPFDFLFIDGGHTAEEVESDWNNYAPMVREGGTIAFHDVCCIDAVREVFERQPRNLTIYGPTGIGVVFV